MKAFHRPKEQQRQRPVGEQPAGKNVFSYYGSQATLRGGARSIEIGQVGHKLRLMPTIIAASVIILSLLFSLTVSTHPSVSLVSDQTAMYHSLATYEAAAQDLLSDELSYRTKLTINTKEIEQKLLEAYPELAAASLRLPVIGRRANLVLELKKPAVLLTTTTKSFVLDSSGQIISTIQDLETEARNGLPVVLDLSGLDLQVGDHAVTSETVAFIIGVAAQLKAQDLSVSQMTLPALANQLDITLQGTPYYIKTDISGDARLQVGSYLAVRDRLEKDGVTPTEYVDVRVEEKVFYK